ncbi:type I-E CRISPR-associated protein Cse1/CasA [Streptomyces abikoensis]|uniref:type I-E CRISPR-associated protein Cse1/CasA n=1 Tax=Streptomyces abikoensis TaxID=97398 RepID=UPI0033C00600
MPESTTAPTASYDLLTEPWIPVHDGTRPGRVGIREALLRSHELWLAAPNTGEIVLLRLLAAVYGAAAAPATEEEWDTAWRAPELDEDRITAYLNTWSRRFDLYDTTHPFLQCAELTTASHGPAILNIAARGSAGGVHTDARLARGEDNHPAWEPAHAALALLTVLGFDTAGVKRAVPGDPAARGNKIYGSRNGPLGVTTHAHIDTGGPLKELLLLATPPGARQAGDMPAWERPSPSAPSRKRAADGRLDRLTWPSRRVRLLPDDEGKVARVAFYVGDQPEDRFPDIARLDPMTAWHRKTASKPAPLHTIDVTSWPVPWMPALTLGTGWSCHVVDHVVAAAERGVLDRGAHVRVVLSQTLHNDRYGSVINDITITSALLGTAGALADHGLREKILAGAHLANDLPYKLSAQTAELTGLPLDQVRPRMTLSELEMEWEEFLLGLTDDTDQATDQWRQALAGLASKRIAAFPRTPPHVRQQLHDRIPHILDYLQHALAGPPHDDAPEPPEGTAPGSNVTASLPGRKPQLYEAFGQMLTLRQIADHPECKVGYHTLRNRIVKQGMTPEQAARTPSQRSQN